MLPRDRSSRDIRVLFVGGGCSWSPYDPGVSCAGGHVMGGAATYVVGKMGCRSEGLAREALRGRFFAARPLCKCMRCDASACESMQGVREKFFSGEMRLRPGPAIRVGASGYVRTRAGQDGHGKQVPGAVFHGECSGGGPGVWPGAAGEIWPDEVRTTGFTLWRLVPDIGWVWAV